MAEREANVVVEHGTYGFRGGIYHLAWVRWTCGKRNRKVEITVSPSGRSVTVYVDGKRWKEVPA